MFILNIIAISRIYRNDSLDKKIGFTLASLSFWLFVAFMLFVIAIIDSRPRFNYYSEQFYKQEFSEVTGLDWSNNSKIIAKNDSIYSSPADYEHKLFCLISMNKADKQILRKSLKNKGLSVRDSLREDELNNSFFMVPENNPLKGFNHKDFTTVYEVPSVDDFQDSYIIAFHKNGRIVLFILQHI